LTKAKENGIISRDFVQIYERGISLDNFKEQLTYLKKWHFKMVLLNRTLFNGILKLSDIDFQQKQFF
jgi:hypothetical protein